MKEFFEGFKEAYSDLFSFIYLNRKDTGKFFAYISMIITIILFFTFVFKFCTHLGGLEARKEYTAEIIYISEAK